MLNTRDLHTKLFYEVDIFNLDLHLKKVAHLPEVGQDKRLLFIGENAGFFSENMAGLNYLTEALEDIPNTNTWLNRVALNPGELPDAIICDLKFLDGDAYSLFGKIQSHKNLKHIPFIIISEEHTHLNKTKALESGIDDFYSLPFNANDLHQRITFLKQFKPENAAFSKNTEYRFEDKIPISKRAFDIAVTLLALTILSPVFLLIALVIKLESRGPVFYVSKRVGRGYMIFNFYKFRSMHQNADEKLVALKHLNHYKDKVNSVFFSDIAFVKIDDDPRITRVGKILRRLSLDELPQLLNVLKGDMSIVGNRPLPLYEAEQLTRDGWAKRFLAPAGITGLWQVTERGGKEMSAEERIKLDIVYAESSSLWFDLQIIFKTIPAVFQKRAL